MRWKGEIMPNTDERISELEKEIASLPVGYISKKTIMPLLWMIFTFSIMALMLC